MSVLSTCKFLSLLLSTQDTGLYVFPCSLSLISHPPPAEREKGGRERKIERERETSQLVKSLRERMKGAEQWSREDTHLPLPLSFHHNPLPPPTHTHLFPHSILILFSLPSRIDF
jgi:hypothetical protein